jgi:hypothetical protein
MEPDGSLPQSQLPATCPFLSQLDPVHEPTFHFLKIYFNIILSSMPGTLKVIIGARNFNLRRC